MANAARQAEVERVRAEGFEAAMNGRHVQTNPYPTSNMNSCQWAQGYMDGLDNLREQERLEKEAGDRAEEHEAKMEAALNLYGKLAADVRHAVAQGLWFSDAKVKEYVYERFAEDFQF